MVHLCRAIGIPYPPSMRNHLRWRAGSEVRGFVIVLIEWKGDCSQPYEPSSWEVHHFPPCLQSACQHYYYIWDWAWVYIGPSIDLNRQDMFSAGSSSKKVK
jgi:hypothetical protein